VNEWTEEKIEGILKDYGDEKFSKKIAKNIVEQRKLGRIKKHVSIDRDYKRYYAFSLLEGKIHYATRTFQALRIAVNDELEKI